MLLHNNMTTNIQFTTHYTSAPSTGTNSKITVTLFVVCLFVCQLHYYCAVCNFTWSF